jgi:hypothetical protein
MAGFINFFVPEVNQTIFSNKIFSIGTDKKKKKGVVAKKILDSNAKSLREQHYFSKFNLSISFSIRFYVCYLPNNGFHSFTPASVKSDLHFDDLVT